VLVTQAQLRATSRALFALTQGKRRQGVAALALLLFEPGGDALVRLAADVDNAARVLRSLDRGADFDAGVLILAQALTGKGAPGALAKRGSFDALDVRIPTQGASWRVRQAETALLG